jgi:solute carrier family 50 protein (sugar transporter)
MDNVWLDTIAPLIGAFLSVGLYLAALPEVLRITKAKSLGKFDPIPTTYLLCTCVGWMCYGFLLDIPSGYYIFFSNLPGLGANLFSFLSMFILSSEETQKKMSRIVLVFSMTLALGSYISVIHLTNEQAKLVVGIISNAALVMFYMSPITTMYKMIKTKNSGMLYIPVVFLSFFNSLMWLCFGIAVMDYMIITPQAFGVFLGITQLILISVFRLLNRPLVASPIDDDRNKSSDNNEFVSLETEKLDSGPVTNTTTP